MIIITLENFKRAQDQREWMSEEDARKARQEDLAENIQNLRAAHASGNKSEGGCFPHSWSDAWWGVLQTTPIADSSLKTGD